MNMSNRLLIIPLLCLAAWAPGCDQTEHSFQVYEENGIIIAETIGGPKYDGELFTYEKEMVIDTGQSDETLLYTPIQFMADAEGNFYINDLGIGSILVFDSEGQYQRSIGRKGQGPGESNGGRLQMVHDGIIQFYDLSLRRTTRFKTDGTFLDVISLPVGVGLLRATGFVILEDDIRLALTADSNMANQGETQRRGAVTISSNGDTLAIVYTPWIRLMKKTEITVQGRTIAAPTPLVFGPFPTSFYHPAHGIILSSSIQPDLNIFDTAGRKIRTIRIVMDAEPVTAQDREESRQNMLSLREGQTNEMMKQMYESQAENMQFADYKSFWGMAEIDSDGYFWLDTSLAGALGAGETHTYRLLSPEGEYLGDTTRPFKSGSSVSHGRFLILEEDPESGEIVPTVYRIRSAVAGLKYP